MCSQTRSFSGTGTTDYRTRIPKVRRSQIALVGLVSVSTSKQETRRQHDGLDPICVKLFEEKVSGKLKVADRPGLQAALEYMRPGDLVSDQA